MITGAHSHIIDGHIDSELFTQVCGPNTVYDLCQQSYCSKIVASCSFDLEDGTDEKVHASCFLPCIFYLVPCLTRLFPYIHHLRARGTSSLSQAFVMPPGAPPCVPRHTHNLADSTPPTTTLVAKPSTPITALLTPRAHVLSLHFLPHGSNACQIIWPNVINGHKPSTCILAR